LINYAGHSYTVSTDDAISTFSFFTFDSSTTEGGAFLGCNKLHQPIYYYPWSEDFTNGNIVITGIPGSGKSFSINTLLANIGAWNHDVFIVDKSKSYEFLCNMQRGQYITLDLDGKYSVNIFDCVDYDKDLIDATSNDNDINADGTVTANKIAQIVGFFKTIIKSESDSAWQLERSLIETAIAQTYKSKLKISKDGKISPDSMPTLSDFHEIFSKMAEKKTEWKKQILEISEKLNSYIDNGQYAKFVDRRTSFDITSSFIVFDTSGLPEDEDLQSLAVYIISTFLTKKFKQNKKLGKKQLLMVDETWTLARFPAGVTFLLNLSKRSRHMGLVCAFATQQMSDFFGNPDAAQLFKNVENFILFKQSDTDLDNWQKNLDLNDQERNLIGSLEQVKGEYSDAFVKFGKTSNLVKVRPNPPLNWIATTNKTDAPIKARVLKEENYNYEKAIERLVEKGG
jgi:type IV secretory pathway VirB4 component